MAPEGIGSDRRLAALSTIVGRLGATWSDLDPASRLEELDRIQQYVGDMRRFATHESDAVPREGGLGLTLRERQVLALLVEGRSTTQLARTLGISTGTVRSHIKNLMSKLGVHSRLEAVALVRKALPEFEDAEEDNDDRIVASAFS